jgi:hypothetical protein
MNRRSLSVRSIIAAAVGVVAVWVAAGAPVYMGA